MPQFHPARGFAALILLALLTACSGEKPSSPSQVLARVNDTEITGLQLNYVLAHQGRPGKDENAARQAALDQLVDQELLVQQAVKQKLDRDPTVLQAIEHARRQVLAQAAAERLLAQKTPSSEDITEFYRAHPALFEGRKVYRFAAFSVAQKALPENVTSQLDAAKTPEEVRAVLNAGGVEFQATEMKRAAEQLPLPMLDQIDASHPGDIVALPDGDRLLLLQHLSADAAPLNEKQAEPFIRSYLQNTRMQEEARQQLAGLRAAAKVEYVKRFAAQPAAPRDAAVQPGQTKL
ncbi:EpsD family peptidyl-prolyl cis-trans isomerase [Chitinolyticbacter meiyuanensis]|uniref:EpsD family peptidyl-prolyl cis-trans isomerase n=1 Tax=Chitinolyticbacter meiyuanensis TaxID=682798 RepID=UPI001652330C|nr:EpsD family peptidyl-prolyl cis-trans isomerase [Chitinolyticbacter meiyuanensis]